MLRKIKCRRCGGCAKTTRGLPLAVREKRAVEGKVPLLIVGGHKPITKIPVEKDHVCVAFAAKSEKGHCKIYAVRPAICRQYPILFFHGRAIIQKDCTAVKELIAEGKTSLSRKEIGQIPFLRKSLEALEKAFPAVKKQESFRITNT